MNFERSPEDVFPDLQKGLSLVGQTIKSIVPNQTILSEGRREFNAILMVVLILFLWPGAIIYYFTSSRSSLSIVVTKSNETGSTVAINSKGKDGEKIITYMFYHLQKHEEKSETDTKEKED